MANKSQNTNADKPKRTRSPRNKPPANTVNNLPQEQEHTTQENIAPEEKKKAWKAADTIAIVAILINAMMFAATYMLFHEAAVQTKVATKSSDAAKISAEAAEKSANLQKQALDSQISAKKQSDLSDAKKYERDTALFNLQKQAFAINKRDVNERFKRDTTAIGLQIRALKQNADQFTQQNEPYLKVAIDSVFIRYGKLGFDYTILNLSNTPARVIGENASVEVSAFKPLTFRYYEPVSPGEFYVIKESPQPKEFTLINCTPDQIKWVMNGTYSIYWNCTFKYINMVSDEKRIYAISAKITRRGKNAPYQEFSENSNKTDK